ncbi:MAG: EF-P lysine aminoacylase GenX [Alphaproteobacteria bacterium]|nr:EF-P lysine aminoacylase GenX [Alphaproteobacteria bacterium]
MSNDQKGQWWRPDAHADRRPFLMQRGRIREALRAYFVGEGFTEVECGALQVSPGNEAHLHAFATSWIEEGGAAHPLYLHTSPEFAAKKLLAAGERRIFDFARVYRNRESGPLHAPEFTMLEWYRAGETWDAVMADSVALCRLALTASGGAALTWRGQTCYPAAEPERLTLVEAFGRHAGIDLEPVLASRDGLAEAARGQGVRVAGDDGWSDIFSRILVERIEPHLGRGRLTLLCEYPTAEAALARPRAGDPRFAERFELYACGVELANGFGELTDADEQRYRFQLEMAEKQRLYDETYPVDEDFLDALAIMPEASGVALGFDRLVMLASGARRIEDVLWTPFRP